MIPISSETYRLLKRRATEANATPEQLAEAAIRLQFGNTPHIEQRDTPAGPRAMIRGTRVAVAHVAGFLDGGFSVEEIVSEALPDVPPAAIYEALAYYYEHQAEIEADWAANEQEAGLAELRQQLLPEQLARFRGQTV
ncbi:MAG: DUF433 domain-containing protein [Candidatus Promineofilum sp.]|jgi:uncharacterized protein (DUF433 family)|nr:DUF433 domain-containing protein [Promineifilum sp.]